VCPPGVSPGATFAKRTLDDPDDDQFGEPSANVRAALDSLADVNRIEELTVRLKRAASWQELLGLAGPRRRSPRRKPSS
jgi:hypothetical protein